MAGAHRAPQAGAEQLGDQQVLAGAIDARARLAPPVGAQADRAARGRQGLDHRALRAEARLAPDAGVGVHAGTSVGTSPGIVYWLSGMSNLRNQ
jgi:hypothetical protein